MKSSWKRKALPILIALCIGIFFLNYLVGHYHYQITQDGSISIDRVQAYLQKKDEYSTKLENEYKEYELTEANIDVKVPLKTQDVHVHKRDYLKLSTDQTYNLFEAERNHSYSYSSKSKQIQLRPELYVFSLSYMDQMSWASTRWRSLQCWASQLSQRYSVHVIEPFVTNGTHLGVPTLVNQSQHEHETLKFGDIFDTNSWQRNSPLSIVSWDAFLSSGARNVVTVQMVYPYHHHCTENGQTDKMCNNKRMQRLFSQHLAMEQNNFNLVKSTCINFRELDFLTVEQFNDVIFANIPKELPVTIMFDEWRGLGENSCFVHVSGGNCSVCNKSFIDTTLKLMTPSSRIKSAAHKYIKRYLYRQNGFAAIMIRWEKILLYNFYYNASRHYSGSGCLKSILNYVMHLHKSKNINAFFLTTDIGKYGSSTFDLYNSTRVRLSKLTDYTEQLLRILNHSKSLNLKEHEQTFEKVSGTTNPAFISQMQKAISVRAHCLLLVGWGNFITNTLDMYKSMHKERPCYKQIMLC